MASKMVMNAKADIFSCAIIADIKGTLVIPMRVATVAQCRHQRAAVSLPAGMFICVSTNHIPTVSISMIIKMLKHSCTTTEVENTNLSLSSCRLPNYTVINRPMAALIELVIMPKRLRNPPIALYMP